MADAYARMSAAASRCCRVHQGCGLTNAMTGITEAAKSRTPLIVLAADTAGAAVRSNFRIDQDALVRSVGAVAERVHSAGIGRRRHHPRLPHRRQRPAHRGAQPPAGRAGRRGRDAPAGAGAPSAAAGRPGAAVVEALAACSATPSARCLSPAAAPWRRPEIAALADGVGALLADLRGGEGPVPRRPVRPRHLRRVRLPAGRRTDRRRRPDRRLGLRLNMWTMRHGSLSAPDATVDPDRRRSRRTRRAPADPPRRAAPTSERLQRHWPTA